MRLIGEIWKGKRSLAETFWLWNVVFGNIVYIVGISIFNPVVALILSTPFYIWIVVGLWRSASNNPGFWASLVQIIMVVGLIYVLFILFSNL